MSHPSFAVRRFKNRNGISTWRVDGRINGVRIRRNFASQEEAAAEKAALQIKSEQIAAGMQSVVTCLTGEQVREAEAAFHRLTGRARSLTFYLDHALANYRDPIRDVGVTEAVNTYIELREQDEKQNHLSHRQLQSIKWELRTLEATFRKMTVAELTASALTEYFKRGCGSKKTYNNRRGLVGAFLKYCLLKDWVVTNVVEKVPHFRGVGHRRGSAPTLTAEQCAEIMEWAETHHEAALVTFIALCLFAGIRPDLYQGEISKLKPEHVRLDTGVIMVEPEVSKVRMKRAVTIQPNLAAWLRAYPLEDFPIWPRGFRRLRLEFRKKFNLSHDILRHTFISMFVGKYRSLGDAALQAGNSESIIRKHYLDLKSKEEAEQFYAIMPKHGAGSANKLPAAA